MKKITLFTVLLVTLNMWAQIPTSNQASQYTFLDRLGRVSLTDVFGGQNLTIVRGSRVGKKVTDRFNNDDAFNATGLTLNRTGLSASVSNGGNNNPQYGVAFSFWIKIPTTSFTKRNLITGKGSVTTTNNSSGTIITTTFNDKYVVSLQNGQIHVNRTYDQGTQRNLTRSLSTSNLNVPLADGNWHHVAINLSYNNNSRIYVDGDLKVVGLLATISEDIGVIDSIRLFENDSENASSYDGDFDDLILYQRILSSLDVYNIYTNNYCPSDNAGSYSIKPNTITDNSVAIDIKGKSSIINLAWAPTPSNPNTIPTNFTAIDRRITSPNHAGYTRQITGLQPGTDYSIYTQRICQGTTFIKVLDFTTTGGTLSTDNFKTSEPLNIYPNPIKDIVNINTTETISAVSLYTLVGEKITLPVSKKINLSEVSSGVYFLVVKTEKGKILTQKIVKE